jgi:DNA-binding NarL/FixJ family response regulator
MSGRTARSGARAGRAHVQDPWRLRVVLIEGHEIARRGLHEMLSSLPLVSRVDSFDSLDAATRVIRDDSPDVVIVPSDVSETEAYRLVSAQIDTRILVLLRRLDPSDVCPALRDRINGYLFEPDLTVEDLASSLVQAANGDAVLPQQLTEQLLRRAQKMSGDPPRYLLSPREIQVLELLGEGLSNKQIAGRLSISLNVAKRHVAMVLAKLNCPNRTLAVAKAIRERLLAPSA